MKNYEVIKQKFIKEVNSDVVLLKHIKSGAHVLLFKNNDPNKVFSIGFRTPPTNDTGVPHILEHSTLCGSKKFPVKDPFIELAKSSLNTFLNAMTYPDKTVYPVASLNDHDFKNLMEVYMDAVFYPNVYIHEEIFKQEGWHYELESTDQDITYNGVVYNEMKGAFSSPEQVVMRVSRHALFPDTTYGVESGGDPDFIPELTYDEFKDFHRKYYHPVNSYIILYGNMDMDEKLKWMDEEYLSKFDKIAQTSNIDYQTPFKNHHVEEYFYPVGREESLENKTFYSYNVCTSTYKDVLTNYALQVLNYALFASPAAPVRKALQNAGIGTDILCDFDSGMLQEVLSVIIKNAPSNKLDEVRKIINETLTKLVKDGIDKLTLRSAINFYEFKYREADFSGAPTGLIYALNSMDTWLYDESDPFSSLEFYQIFETLNKNVETNYFENLVEKTILNNPHVAWVVLSPSNTLQEEKDKALKAKLQSFKETLTKEELESLVEQTKALKIYQETPSTEEELRTIPKLTKEDISEKIQELPNKEVVIDDVKVIEHDVDTKGISYIDFNFNILNIKEELLPYVGIVKRLLTNVDTKDFDYESLLKEINIYTGGITSDISVYTKASNDALAYFTISTKALDNNVNHIFRLLKTIITTSNMQDKKRLKEILFETKSKLQMFFMSSGHVAAINRALSYISLSSYLQDILSGISQYKFIETLCDDFDGKADEIIKNLKLVMTCIFRKENLLISYTGKQNLNKEFITDLNLSLNQETIEKYTFNFTPHILNEGFKTPSMIQYVARVGKFSDISKYSGSFNVLRMALSYDYLWMKVRVLGGAYGCMCNFTRNGNVYFVSYRDPNLEATNEVYEQVINYISSFNPSDEQLTSYIISAIGVLDTPLTPREKGNKAFVNYLLNITNEDLIKERLQVINTTVEDIHALKPLIEEALKCNCICTIGNEEKIEGSKLFKEKKYLMK